MRKNVLVPFAILAAALLAGCGNKLDQPTAKALLEDWARGNVVKAVGPVESMDPPACRESLVKAGYMRQSGPNSVFYVSTGKLAPVAPPSREHGDFFLLPLLKTEIMSVSPPAQIPGERSAEVKFTYRQLPGQPGVDIACAKGGLIVPGNATFDLTEKGWALRKGKGVH